MNKEEDEKLFMEIKKETDIDEEFDFDDRSLDITSFQDDGKIEKLSVLKSDDPEEGLVKIETEPDIDQMLISKKKARKKNDNPVIPKVCPICAKEVKYLNGHIKEVHTDLPSENHICHGADSSNQM